MGPLNLLRNWKGAQADQSNPPDGNGITTTQYIFVVNDKNNHPQWPKVVPLTLHLGTIQLVLVVIRISIT